MEIDVSYPRINEILQPYMDVNNVESELFPFELSSRKVSLNKDSPKKRGDAPLQLQNTVPIIGKIKEKYGIDVYNSNPKSFHSKFPVKFKFVIGDDRGHIVVVVWNSAVLNYFRHLEVGDLVLIRNYRVKYAYGENGMLIMCYETLHDLLFCFPLLILIFRLYSFFRLSV